jgi:hypothetical protein
VGGRINNITRTVTPLPDLGPDAVFADRACAADDLRQINGRRTG